MCGCCGRAGGGNLIFSENRTAAADSAVGLSDVTALNLGPSLVTLENSGNFQPKSEFTYISEHFAANKLRNDSTIAFRSVKAATL